VETARNAGFILVLEREWRPGCRFHQLLLFCIIDWVQPKMECGRTDGQTYSFISIDKPMGASPRSAFSTRDIVNPACGQFLLNIVGSGSHVTWLFSIICDPSQAWDVLSGLAKPVHGTTSPLQPHISVIWREMWPLLAVVPNLFHGSDSAQAISVLGSQIRTLNDL